MPDCIIFDLDATLAKSKQPIDKEMAQILVNLLAKTQVAVASGGMFTQLKTQVADQLPETTDLTQLYFLSTSGSALYAYHENIWTNIYEEPLSQEEADDIINAIHTANNTLHMIDFESPSDGDRIEFRGTQVSLSALGQQAPLEKKEAWDPSRSKREGFRAILIPLLPSYEVRIGGTTTIDITKKGIDKAYGVKRLAEYLTLSISNMLYVGDELGIGGNDEVVIATGIPTHSVVDPEDTKRFIKLLLAQ